MNFTFLPMHRLIINVLKIIFLVEPLLWPIPGSTVGSAVCCRPSSLCTLRITWWIKLFSLFCKWVVFNGLRETQLFEWNKLIETCFYRLYDNGSTQFIKKPSGLTWSKNWHRNDHLNRFSKKCQSSFIQNQPSKYTIKTIVYLVPNKSFQHPTLKTCPSSSMLHDIRQLFKIF